MKLLVKITKVAPDAPVGQLSSELCTIDSASLPNIDVKLRVNLRWMQENDARPGFSDIPGGTECIATYFPQDRKWYFTDVTPMIS